MELINGRTRADWARYDRVKLIVALLLALLLLVLWLLGRGPSACAACSAGVSAPAATGPVTTAAAPIVAPAAASATTIGMEVLNGKVTLTGTVRDEAVRKALFDAAVAAYGAGNVVDQLKIDAAASAVPWASKAPELFAWLKGKGDIGMKITGADVVLTGSVANTGAKTEAGTWAQAFFGADAKVDNQLQVTTPVAAAAKPAAVKVYFATGQSNIDAADRDALGPIIDYVRKNDGTKAVLSGFHDPRGNKAANEELAKNRAKAVRDILRSAQLSDAQIDMRKPQETTGSGDLKEARRVEVSVE
jgi:outer membrane protein OmpA-like peptidoglycan-associated protein